MKRSDIRLAHWKFIAVLSCLLIKDLWAATPPPEARIEFAAPVFDFGKIVCGEVVKHSFTFTNAGNQALQINGVKSSCGCAVISTWSRQVEPGKSGTIPIEIHSRNLEGEVRKEVEVHSNDAKQPVYRLEVKGTIWKPIDVIPANAVFNLSSDTSTNLARVIRIVNKSEEPLTLSAPESNQPLLTATLRTNQPGKEYEVAIHLTPPKTSGNVFGQIKLKTSLAQMPEVSISAWALAPPAVTVNPAIVSVPAGTPKEKLARMISIRGHGEKPLQLSAPRVNAPGIETQLKELQPGRLYSITLMIPEGFQLKPGERVELSVNSNHPQFPIIKVPIVAETPRNLLIGR